MSRMSRTETRFVVMLCLVTLLVPSGCATLINGDPVEAVDTPPPTAAPASELNVYNWDTYIDPAILDGFEQAYGVTVNYTTFASNEEMLEEVLARPGSYDIIVPSDYMVAIMRSQGLLAPLDKTNIPNLNHVDPDFLNTGFDPGTRYCVPYQWGTMGIGYNVEATGGEINGLSDLFDPVYAGRVAMLDDVRMSLGIVLLSLGYSPNTTSETQIAEARDFLIGRAEQIAAYAPDTGQDLLAAGEVDLVFEWSGDILQLMEEDPSVRYVIPNEGTLIWSDNMCIPAGAPHKELAEAFINYILEPEVGAALSNYTHFSSPNQAATGLINASDRNNPALYPPDDVRRRLFYVVDVGPSIGQIYEQAWAEVLAAHGQ